MTRSSRAERLTSSLIGASLAVARPVDHQATPDPTGVASSNIPIHLLRFLSISTLRPDHEHGEARNALMDRARVGRMPWTLGTDGGAASTRRANHARRYASPFTRL